MHQVYGAVTPTNNLSNRPAVMTPAPPNKFHLLLKLPIKIFLQEKKHWPVITNLLLAGEFSFSLKMVNHPSGFYISNLWPLIRWVYPPGVVSRQIRFRIFHPENPTSDLCCICQSKDSQLFLHEESLLGFLASGLSSDCNTHTQTYTHSKGHDWWVINSILWKLINKGEQSCILPFLYQPYQQMPNGKWEKFTYINIPASKWKEMIELEYSPLATSHELMRASQVALVVKNHLPVQEISRDLGWIPRSGRSPGEGNGDPPQYSCQENSMDRGAWGVTVHRVAKRPMYDLYMTSVIHNWSDMAHRHEFMNVIDS